MERSIANEMLATIRESELSIKKAIAELKGACPEETWLACGTKLVGPAMTDMFDYVMAPIYNEHPDLAPNWYREGTPLEPWVRHLKLSKEARDRLLTAFEAAYEKVQSATGLLPQISDPLELAMYSYGVHQASARLCNARVILLCAELES